MRNLLPTFDLIRRHEGCKLTAYQDTGGVWTIGYGHTLNVTEGMGISQLEADQMLSSEVKEFAEHMDSHLTRELSDNQFCALLDFTYNEGVGRLIGSTLLKLINENASDLTIGDEFMKWVYQGRTVLPGLVKRRSDEKALWLTPSLETLVQVT